MIQRLLQLLCLLGCLVWAGAPAAHAASDNQSVLVLNSYHKGFKWTDDITDGIESVLERGLSSLSHQVEFLYMDSKRNYTPEYFAFLRQVYAIKFKDRRFDVIIASDNNALDFLLNYREQLFPGTPVVFCGVNAFSREQLRGQRGYTGVNEATDIPATLQLMMRLHPQTKHLLVVEDQTTTGHAMAATISDALKTLPPAVEVIRPTAITMPELQRQIIHLPPDSLVLYSLFLRDARGVTYEYDQSIKLLAGVAKVPIYGVWDFDLGFGIVGGRLTSGFFQGETAAKLALRILGGERVDRIPVVMTSPNRYMFDDRQLDRFHIARRKLPAGSIRINIPDPRLRLTLIGSTVGGILALVIIALMAHSLHLRKRHKQALESAYQALERKVEERTRDLATANQRLSREVREREEAEARIRQLAYHDSLTGLPNRNLFIDRLEQALARHRRTTEKGILFYLDLDGFKTINDTYGHQIGDEVLCATVRRVETLIRGIDTLARWGGDEFVLLVPETKKGLSAETITHRIHEAMAAPMVVDGLELHVGISVGVAHYPHNGMDLDTLLAAADHDMYNEKARRKRQQTNS